jgi:hypothetical protein
MHTEERSCKGPSRRQLSASKEDGSQQNPAFLDLGLPTIRTERKDMPVYFLFHQVCGILL